MIYDIKVQRYLVLFYVLIFGIMTSAAFAWNISGDVAVCTSACEQKFPAIARDGSGGAIITWQDYRGTTGHIAQGIDIYAQRINASGIPQWTTNGVAVCTTVSDQNYPTIVSDDNGGAIISWEGGGIHAQRLNSSGIPQWTTNGVAVCTAAFGQYYQMIASDGSGGAIITWVDMRNGYNYDIYAQSINSSGIPQWMTNGIAICTAVNYQQYPMLVSDGNGGAIIAWQDGRSGNDDIYTQSINSSGIPQWTANGVAICTAANNQDSPMIISDGNDGAIITWQDNRNGDNDIYAQSINSSGILQWTTNGVAVCTTANGQDSPQIVSDGSGGAIITWNTGGGGVYAQRINASGDTQWTMNGVAVCTAAGSQWYPMLISDNSDGAIITWIGGGIYAQKINSSGVSQWAINGITVCTSAGGPSLPTPVSDGGSGAIIAWIDRRSYNSSNIDIYAQSITTDGFVPVELSLFEAMEGIKE